MNRGISLLVPFCIVFASCRPVGTGSGSHIEIVDITPQPQSVVSAQDTVRASLAYSISGEHQSDFGFKIGIIFSSTNPTQTFCTGNCLPVTLAERTDTVAITYALSEIWDDTRLQHPVSCSFYLRKYTDSTRSVVIAKTDPVTYRE